MITWTITNLLRNSETGFVQSAFWKAEILDGDKKYFVEDVCHFVYENNINYVDYSDLTEEKVLDWVFARIDKGSIESNLEDKITRWPAAGIPWE